jgi:hypothetical protein
MEQSMVAMDIDSTLSHGYSAAGEGEGDLQIFILSYKRLQMSFQYLS